MRTETEINNALEKALKNQCFDATTPMIRAVVAVKAEDRLDRLRLLVRGK
jgi:hypothetical protein